MLGELDRLGRRVGAGSRDDGDAAACGGDARLDDAHVLLVRQRRALARRADRHEPVGALRDLPLDEAAEGLLVDLAVTKRRDGAVKDPLNMRLDLAVVRRAARPAARRDETAATGTTSALMAAAPLGTLLTIQARGRDAPSASYRRVASDIRLPIGSPQAEAGKPLGGSSRCSDRCCASAPWCPLPRCSIQRYSPPTLRRPLAQGTTDRGCLAVPSPQPPPARPSVAASTRPSPGRGLAPTAETAAGLREAMKAVGAGQRGGDPFPDHRSARAQDHRLGEVERRLRRGRRYREISRERTRLGRIAGSSRSGWRGRCSRRARQRRSRRTSAAWSENGRRHGGAGLGPGFADGDVAGAKALRRQGWRARRISRRGSRRPSCNASART